MSGASRTRAALGFSVVAHLVLFGALLLTLHAPTVARPLVVRLLEPSIEETAGHPGSSSLPGMAAPLAISSLGKPGAQSVRPLASVARQQAEPAPAQDVSLEPSNALAPPASSGTVSVRSDVFGAVPSAEVDSSQAAGGAHTGAGGIAVNASRLAELHRRLAEAAARCYPAAARRFRLRGEVPVHFCLDPQGGATALSLQGSTGSALLDRSALECVVPGAQPLDGFEGCFLVPVHFGT